MKIHFSIMDGEIHIRTIRYDFSFIRLPRSLREKKCGTLAWFFLWLPFSKQKEAFFSPSA